MDVKARRRHMGIEVLEPARIVETDDTPDTSTGDTPPIFGRCPVCNKPLYPRDRFTDEFKAPPVGTGYESRAKCSRCGTILCYAGGGNWRVLSEADLNEDDHTADKLGL